MSPALDAALSELRELRDSIDEAIRAMERVGSMLPGASAARPEVRMDVRLTEATLRYAPGQAPVAHALLPAAHGKHARFRAAVASGGLPEPPKSLGEKKRTGKNRRGKRASAAERPLTVKCERCPRKLAVAERGPLPRFCAFCSNRQKVQGWRDRRRVKRSQGAQAAPASAPAPPRPPKAENASPEPVQAAPGPLRQPIPAAPPRPASIPEPPERAASPKRSVQVEEATPVSWAEKLRESRARLEASEAINRR